MDAMKREAASGYFLTRLMEGTALAGSGTKQELVELEKNMRQMLQLRMYPYSYIERYMVSIGYRQDAVRVIFKEITGIPATEVMAEDYSVMTVPGCIPQINLGWGETKGAKGGYLFVMPWQVGYAVFEQKNELERYEVKRFDDLREAREFVEKKVKEYHQYGKVIDLDLKQPKADWYTAFSEPKVSALTDQGRAVYDYVKYIGSTSPRKKTAQYIKDAYFNGLINKQDFVILADKFIPAADSHEEEMAEKKDIEELDKLEEQELMKPLSDELRDASPDSFFGSQSEGTSNQDAADMVTSAAKYLQGKTKELAPDFKLAIKSFKYITTPTIQGLQTNVSSPSSKPDELLQSKGVLAVVLTMHKSKLADGANSKMGMMVFSFRDGRLHTNGLFKGIDNKPYSLDKEGMSKYFLDLDGKAEFDIEKNLF